LFEVNEDSFEEPESYRVFRKDEDTQIQHLRIEKEIPFGSRQYERIVKEVEDKNKKSEGFVDSVIHDCGIQLFFKQFITEEALPIIDENCQCNKIQEYAKLKKPYYLRVCPNHHMTWQNKPTRIMKSCKECTRLLNQFARTNTEAEEKQIMDSGKQLKAHEDLMKKLTEAKENAEIEKQAKIIFRAEQMKKEMKHDSK